MTSICTLVLILVRHFNVLKSTCVGLVSVVICFIFIGLQNVNGLE